MSTKWEDRARLWGLGTNWKIVFYGKLTRTTTPKLLSLSPLTTKEHPCKVKKNLQGSFFIINLYSIFVVNFFDPDLQREGPPSTMLQKICF